MRTSADNRALLLRSGGAISLEPISDAEIELLAPAFQRVGQAKCCQSCPSRLRTGPAAAKWWGHLFGTNAPISEFTDGSILAAWSLRPVLIHWTLSLAHQARGPGPISVLTAGPFIFPEREVKYQSLLSPHQDDPNSKRKTCPAPEGCGFSFVLGRGVTGQYQPSPTRCPLT